MKSIVLLALVGFFFFTSCGAQNTEYYKVLSFEDYANAITKENIQLIDVRTFGEFQQGHIKNAINIDVSSPDFNTRVEQLDKEKEVYIYCKSGARSNRAGRIMENLGFKEIYDLKGGISSWRGEINR